jgi:hypothetical protein
MRLVAKWRQQFSTQHVISPWWKSDMRMLNSNNFGFKWSSDCNIGNCNYQMLRICRVKVWLKQNCTQDCPTSSNIIEYDRNSRGGQTDTTDSQQCWSTVCCGKLLRPFHQVFTIKRRQERQIQQEPSSSAFCYSLQFQITTNVSQLRFMFLIVVWMQCVSTETWLTIVFVNRDLPTAALVVLFVSIILLVNNHDITSSN